ncbi:MAG: hypothetical protein K8M05_15760, partial [Deltaproteobacteria bacterium]|nr:hypothetical protein [Kofleriaceae bacterium]
PCGAATVDDLYPSGRDRVGGCAVVRDGEYVTLVDDGRPVMRAADGKPLQLLDPRVPGPAGIRVGMIASEIQAQAPSHGFIACTNFGDLMQCELRRTAIAPDCTSPDQGDVIYLRFPPPGSRADGVEHSGTSAWDAIADSKVFAILLTMPC